MGFRRESLDELELPSAVADGLREFVTAAQSALGPDLVSLVLFGSAAEGRLRASSDVNVIVVSSLFDPARLDALRQPLRLARATIRLSAMLILQSEVASAAEAFAVKFADIRARHKILVGSDPFAALTFSRAAMLMRLKQVLLNYVLRTRERYVLTSLREEQLASVVADAAGPLRSAAALLLLLEGRPATSPKEALETLAAAHDPTGWREPLANLSRAREHASLPPGAGGPTVQYLMGLAQALRAGAEKFG
jgi:predicted nucleotidyltransferase